MPRQRSRSNSSSSSRFFCGRTRERRFWSSSSPSSSPGSSFENNSARTKRDDFPTDGGTGRRRRRGSCDTNERGSGTRGSSEVVPSTRRYIQAEVTSGVRSIFTPTRTRQLRIDFDNNLGVWHLVNPASRILEENKSGLSPARAQRQKSPVEESPPAERPPSQNDGGAPVHCLKNAESKTLEELVTRKDRSSTSSNCDREDAPSSGPDCGLQQLAAGVAEASEQTPVDTATTTGVCKNKDDIAGTEEGLNSRVKQEVDSTTQNLPAERENSREAEDALSEDNAKGRTPDVSPEEPLNGPRDGSKQEESTEKGEMAAVHNENVGNREHTKGAAQKDQSEEDPFEIDPEKPREWSKDKSSEPQVDKNETAAVNGKRGTGMYSAAPGSCVASTSDTDAVVQRKRRDAEAVEGGKRGEEREDEATLPVSYFPRKAEFNAKDSVGDPAPTAKEAPRSSEEESESSANTEGFDQSPTRCATSSTTGDCGLPGGGSSAVVRATWRGQPLVLTRPILITLKEMAGWEQQTPQGGKGARDGKVADPKGMGEGKKKGDGHSRETGGDDKCSAGKSEYLQFSSDGESDSRLETRGCRKSDEGPVFAERCGQRAPRKANKGGRRADSGRVSSRQGNNEQRLMEDANADQIGRMSTRMDAAARTPSRNLSEAKDEDCRASPHSSYDKKQGCSEGEALHFSRLDKPASNPDFRRTESRGRLPPPSLIRPVFFLSEPYIGPHVAAHLRAWPSGLRFVLDPTADCRRNQHRRRRSAGKHRDSHASERTRRRLGRVRKQRRATSSKASEQKESGSNSSHGSSAGFASGSSNSNGSSSSGGGGAVRGGSGGGFGEEERAKAGEGSFEAKGVPASRRRRMITTGRQAFDGDCNWLPWRKERDPECNSTQHRLVSQEEKEHGGTV